MVTADLQQSCRLNASSSNGGRQWKDYFFSQWSIFDFDFIHSFFKAALIIDERRKGKKKKAPSNQSQTSYAMISSQWDSRRGLLMVTP